LVVKCIIQRTWKSTSEIWKAAVYTSLISATRLTGNSLKIICAELEKSLELIYSKTKRGVAGDVELLSTRLRKTAKRLSLCLRIVFCKIDSFL